MILRDKIEVIEGRRTTDDYGGVVTDWLDPVVVATLAAQVDYRSTSATTSGAAGFRIVEQLTAIVRRFPFNAGRQRVRWRGLHYVPDGSERTVTAAGRVHHIEIPLKRATG